MIVYTCIPITYITHMTNFTTCKFLYLQSSIWNPKCFSRNNYEPRLLIYRNHFPSDRKCVYCSHVVYMISLVELITFTSIRWPKLPKHCKLFLIIALIILSKAAQAFRVQIKIAHTYIFVHCGDECITFFRRQFGFLKPDCVPMTKGVHDK